MKLKIKLYSLLALATAFVVGLSHYSAAAAPTTQPFKLHNDTPRLSPFTAVRWNDETAEVQFKGDWYKLVSIDDVAVSDIIDYLKQSDDGNPHKHFAEDLVEVMRDMGHATGSTVKLVLKTLDDQKDLTVADAPMTKENREAVRQHASG